MAAVTPAQRPCWRPRRWWPWMASTRCAGTAAAATKTLLLLPILLPILVLLFSPRPAAAVSVLDTEIAFTGKLYWNESVDGRPSPRSFLEAGGAGWWGLAPRARQMAEALKFTQDAGFITDGLTYNRSAAFATASNSTHVRYTVYVQESSSFLGTRVEERTWATAREVWAVPSSSAFSPSVVGAAQLNVTYGANVTLTADAGGCGGGTCMFTWVVQQVPAPSWPDQSCCQSGNFLVIGPTSATSATVRVGPFAAGPATLAVPTLPEEGSRRLRVQLLATRQEDYTNASPVPVDRFFGSVHAYVDIQEPPPSVVIDSASERLVASANGPFYVSAYGSYCSQDVAACRSEWTVVCDNGRPPANRSYTGQVLTLAGYASASSYSEVDTTAMAAPINCNVTLTLSANGRRSSGSRLVTVSPLPPDCASAVVAPSASSMATQSGSKVCAAHKALRTGKLAKHTANVTISVTDPHGNAAVVEITNITINSPSPSPGCRCRPSAADSCACVPNAAVVGPGAAWLMPQPSVKVDKVWRDVGFRVRFTARVASANTSCGGEAVLWAAKDPAGAAAARGATRTFNSTGFEWPALTC